MMKATRRQCMQAALASSAAALSSPFVARAAAEPPWFPFGTHIYREPHLPLPQLLADLPALKKLGFSMIKIQESWAYDERREGDVDLSNVERVIAAAKQNDLRVFFGVTMEHAPVWLWQKFPDAVMVFEDGLPNVDPGAYVVPADGKPGPCWHHPGVRAAAGRFMSTVVKRLAKHSNIAMWNVWQEVGFYSWALRAGHGKLCYCPHTLTAFRRWLREKYGSIERLNEAWLTPYVAFSDVQPPRVFHMVPSTTDWRAFMDAHYFEDALAWKARFFAKGDPLRRPVMTHVSAPTLGSSSDFALARSVDVFGSSVYPDWATGEWESPLMALEQTRAAAAGKPFWAAELQGGPIGEGLGLKRTPSARDVRRWMMCSLAIGARGICFWNHRPELLWNEAHGFGLLEADGSVGPRAQAAGDMGRALAAHADFFSEASPAPAPLGLIVSQDAEHIAQATGAEVLRAFKAAYRGAYRLAWDAAVPATFVDVGSLGTTEKLPKLLWWPFGIAMSNATAQALIAHVRGGGHVILEAGAGHLNEHGVAATAFLNPVLQDWLGVDGQALQPIAASGSNATIDQLPFHMCTGSSTCKDTQIAPGHVLQEFKLRPNSAARPVLLDQNTIVGVHVPATKVGAEASGTLTLLGTHPGIARQLNADTANAAFIKRLFATLGIEADHLDGVPRRRLVLEQREAWFLFNQGGERKTVNLKSALAGRRATALDRPGPVGPTLQVDDIECLLVDNARV
ncbi:MAG: alpha-amylase family protein [Deltaproteobacteria bacterium]|nr:alpha-amylase family protein [Deltaproteobacteria bacterium]